MEHSEEVPEMPVAPHDLTAVMRRFVAGVTVVTAQHDGRLWGMTATAFCPVSLQPPLVLVCINRASRCHQHIRTSGAFAVQMLRADQREVAIRFATRDQTEQRLTTLARLPRSPRTGVPLLVDCLAWLDCTVAASFEAGDHTVFIGRVTACSTGPDEAPLAYYNRRYTTLQT